MVESSGLKAYNFIKKDSTQAFSCEYYEMFQNSFSYRTPLVAASVKKIIIKSFSR